MRARRIEVVEVESKEMELVIGGATALLLAMVSRRESVDLRSDVLAIDASRQAAS